MTDQLQDQRALEELVRSKDAFLATVSHELRTPLTVVHGMAHELHENWSTFEEEESRELAGMIAEQSSELSFLVDDLLVVARADAGTLVVTAGPVDLRAEVIDALASVPEVVASLVTLEFDDVKVIVDRFRVRQILRNLLTNAIATAVKTSAWSQRLSPIRVTARSRCEITAPVCPPS
jgi:two-component system phosphate regulon sensor histidine kinase PhoR